jgi:hypothetical protein
LAGLSIELELSTFINSYFTVSYAEWGIEGAISAAINFRYNSAYPPPPPGRAGAPPGAQGLGVWWMA